MKKGSTAAAKQSRNLSQQKLTIGLDLGDRNGWYCVLNEAGQIQIEQRVRTTEKALREVFELLVGEFFQIKVVIVDGMIPEVGFEINAPRA